MPRVYTKTAKFDTYNQGATVPSTRSKSGTRRDRSKPADADDTLFCAKGDTYYEWKFRYGGAHRSTTPPRASQLTQSEFLGQMYGLTERLEDLTLEGYAIDNVDDLASQLCEIIDELETLRDEQAEKRENMPESLQESPTGEMLRERYDACEEMIDALTEVKDAAECYYPDDEDDDEEGEDDEEENPLNEMIENAQNVTYEGP